MENLSARKRQVLLQLLHGASEKQVAASLGLRQNTVHEYVEAIYKIYGVYSRSELLGRFIPWHGDRPQTSPENVQSVREQHPRSRGARAS